MPFRARIGPCKVHVSNSCASCEHTHTNVFDKIEPQFLLTRYTGKLKADQCGSHLCCQIKNACDVCNGHKDKPQKLRLRWVGNGGAPSSISFSSKDICVQKTTLTSGSNRNEVVLDAASCYGSGSKLPTNIYFQVDGSTAYLHASCSQPLNLGDVLYTDSKKGFLVLVGFRAMSGRTDGACPVGPIPPRDQCTCNDSKQCFGDVLRQMRRNHYRLECELVKPKICEAVTTVNIYPECGRGAHDCSHADGFKLVTCPCQGKCFDGKTCQSTKCPCNSIDCPDWSSRKPSLLDYIKKGECVCGGDTPCLSDYTLPKCDICNLRKDKPQTLIFRWVGKAGAQSSIKFLSEGTCAREQTLTSGSKSNEVVLDATCFGSGSKIPTNIYFTVDGASAYLHASCSQPLNVGDVVYKHQSKGSLVLVGFRSVSGRTESDCPKAMHTCEPRSGAPYSLQCGAGIALQKGGSTKGVALRMNTDFSIQYMWRPTRGVLSSSWTDEFEYTTLSCDGDKVQAKVIVNVHKICAAGQWTKAVGTKTTGTKCVNCDAGTWRQVAASSSAFAENKAAVCKPHKTCSAGQWTKAVGTKSTDTKCVGCDVGTWRAATALSNAYTENKIDVCIPHKVCPAGQWTKAVGTMTSDTECVDCDVGTWRRIAPVSSAFAEHKSVVCKVHKTCEAGQWTETVGTKSTDTECVDCDVGTWREFAPGSCAAVEHKSVVCIPHKMCSTGQWTKAVGTKSTDTECVNCDVGTWREVAPASSAFAEHKSVVCQTHTLCAAGQWTRSSGTVMQDTECVFCSSGRFRNVAPSARTPEIEAHVCLEHRTCQAGEWTVTTGTVDEDTGCIPCAVGTARPSAPHDKTTIESASSCAPCTGTSEYSDERGLTACKTCPTGYFGVVMVSSPATGGHRTCNEATCKRPTNLPANSAVIAWKCPDHGKHTGMMPDTCTLTCKPGFYSSASSHPFTCTKHGERSAAYQRGSITCTGEPYYLFGH